MDFWNEWRQRIARGWVQAVYRSAWARRLFWGLLFTALFTGVLAFFTVPRRLQVVVGEPAPRQIDATRDVVNRIATERLRDQAAAAVKDVYEVNPQVLEQQVRSLQAAFDELRSLRQSPMPEADKLKLLSRLLPETDPVLKAVLQSLMQVSDDQLDQMETEATAHLRNLLADPVSEEDANAMRAALEADWTPQTVDDRNLQLLIKGLVRTRIRANVQVNEAATEEARQRAREAVAEIWVKRDQKIVGAREIITEEHYAMLRDLGLVGPGADTRTLAGLALFCLLCVGLTGLYLWRYRPDILERDTRVIMIGSIALLTMLLALLVKGYSVYLMPLALGGMLLTILMDAQVALVVSIMLTLLTGLIVQDQIGALLVGGIGAIVGVYSLRRVEQRSDLIRAGLVVALANMLAVLAVFLFQGRMLADLEMLEAVGAGAGNGILAAMLTIGTLPFLEGIFGVLTPIKLLELANPNHPLLRKLMVDAPGTYHHTILVANLSEAASEAIGADPMLTRVGCYYHDIGKAKRPYFFTENQFGGENPHDKLPPHLSALIIANHVKDGVEMAREHRLPEEIIDFIREHHGDMLISYFYHKATENGKNEYILEEDFRYEGPRPRRRETAIAMLADGSEASVRALRQKGHLTQEQIEDQVQKIIQDRLHQGQLDRCDLTLRDLEVIRRTFVKILSGAHHARIEYPHLVDKAAEEVKEAVHGDPDLKPAGAGAGESLAHGAGAAGGDPQPGTGGSPSGH